MLTGMTTHTLDYANKYRTCNIAKNKDTGNKSWLTEQYL